MELLTTGNDASLDVPTLPSPWLLCPKNELSTEEERDLFATLRTTLLSKGRRPSDILAVIHRLEGERLLPLLYACRVVSKRYATRHTYWPHFRTHVLGEALTLGDVQRELAPALSLAWLRFHSYTKGALYFPREGLTNIKWPLAHAGLMSSDIDDSDDPLVAFGLALRASTAGDLAGLGEILQLDAQDFYILLTDWLRNDPVWAQTSLAQQIFDTSVGQIYAGLCQLWLGENMDRLPAEKSSGQRSLRVGPARLVYDIKAERLACVVECSPVPGAGSLSVRWGALEKDALRHFDAAEGRTHFHPVVFPVKDPGWSAEMFCDASWELEERRMTVPSSPFGRGRGALLLDADSGRQTRNWRSDKTFYLLLPQELRTTEWLESLFHEVTDVAALTGEWRGYLVLWARAKDPLADSTAIEAAETIDRLARALESADAAFTLPSLQSFYATHFELMGSLPIQVDRRPIFPSARPPLVEISGRSATPASIGLYKWDRERARFEEFTKTNIVLSETPQFLDVELDNNVEENTDVFEVRLEHLHASFALRPRPTAFDTPLTLDLKFFCHGIEFSPGQEASPKMLTEGHFEVRAWPEARLLLSLTDPAGTRRELVATDSEGVGFAEGGSLGLHSPGFLDVGLQCRGFTSQTIRFRDGSVVLPEDWKLSGAAPGILEVKPGTLDPGIGLVGYTIPANPWRSRIQESRGTVDADGRASLVFEDLAGQSWLALFTEREGEKNLALAASISQSRSAIELGPADRAWGDWRRWQEVASIIADSPHPVAMRSLLAATRVGAWWASLPNDLSKATWRPVDDGILGPLSLVRSSATPMTLFSAEDFELPEESVMKQAETARVDPGAVESAFHKGFGTGRLRFESEWREIRLSRTDAGILAEGIEDSIVACGDCGAVLPSYEAWLRHSPSGSGLPECRTFRMVRPGLTHLCRVAIYWSSADLLIGLHRLMVKGSRGQLEIPKDEVLVNCIERTRTALAGMTLKQVESTLDSALELLILVLSVQDRAWTQRELSKAEQIVIGQEPAAEVAGRFLTVLSELEMRAS